MQSVPRVAIERVALCGECAKATGATVVGGLEMIRPCEGPHRGAPPAATGLYETNAIEPLADTEPPRKLELVKFAPPTLTPETHASQALTLLASWTQNDGQDHAPIVDDWLCEQAVSAVAKIHELVASSRK